MKIDEKYLDKKGYYYKVFLINREWHVFKNKYHNKVKYFIFIA